MRVAFVMPGVGVENRGAEVFVVELCQALRGQGFDVTLLCRGEAPLPHRKIRALPRDSRWVNALYGASRLGRKVFDTLFLDPLNLEWDTAALSALPHLWRGRYDVIVMEGGLVGAWVCRLLRRLRGTPFLDLAHGNSPKWEGAFARQRPDRVVAFTQAAAAMIRRRAPRARVAAIPHGVDLERFHPGVPPVASPEVRALPRPIVLSAGSVDEHKRVDLTVEAVARLGRGSLIVLGEGPRAEAVDRLAAERLGPGRYLRTKVSREEMPGWYRAADVFALPSRTEAFGLVYLEALACGRPAVAPDDEVRRTVLGDAGLVCDVEDAQTYAGALEAAFATDWGERPRRQAERFPFAETAAAYADLLREVAR